MNAREKWDTFCVVWVWALPWLVIAAGIVLAVVILFGMFREVG